MTSHKVRSVGRSSRLAALWAGGILFILALAGTAVSQTPDGGVGSSAPESDPVTADGGAPIAESGDAGAGQDENASEIFAETHPDESPSDSDSEDGLPLEGDFSDAFLGETGVESESGEEDGAIGSFFGHFGAELRVFFAEPLSDVQPRYSNVSLVFQPGYELPLGRYLVLRAVPHVRLDEHDERRTRFDAREALLQLAVSDLTVTLGMNKVFWGVTESRHLVDIINQTDYAAQIDGDVKLGQLMGSVAYTLGPVGLVEVLATTWFRPQPFPGVRGRPGPPIPVLDDPTYDSSLEQWNVDVAARWSKSVGPFDWALSYFRGTSREPQFELVVMPDGRPAIAPHYDLIQQGGLELQLTLGAWLWKVEGILREGQGPLFWASTGGFEVTLSTLFGTDADLGILLEYNHDERDNMTFNIYDEDAFGGLRLSLNDVASTELLTGAIFDVESGTTFGQAEASRRFGEHWKGSVVGRWLYVPDDRDPLYWFRRDHHLEILAEYHF